MDNETAEAVAEYILKKYKGEEIILRWFGGEPLLNTKPNDIICEILKSKGLKFSSEIVTNGLLLNTIDVKKIKEEWNLDFASITIDGTPEKYKKTKNYIGNINEPFETVIQNIKTLLDNGIKVQIRLNASEENIDDLIKLIDVLENKLDLNKVQIFISPLYEIFQKEKEENDEESAIFLEKLEELIIKANKLTGVKLRTPKIWKLNNCISDSENSITISPEGNISKCSHRTETVIIGNINEGTTKDKEEFFSKKLLTEGCIKCKIFPLCTELQNCSRTKGICNKFNKQYKELILKMEILSEYERWKKEQQAV